MEFAVKLKPEELSTYNIETIARLEKEYIGKKFNHLTVLEFDHVRRRKRGNGKYINLYFFKFECDCKERKIVIANISDVRNGATKSCGHIRGLVHSPYFRGDKTDLIGYKFNEIEVIEYLKEKSEAYNEEQRNNGLKENKYKFFYNCRCSCNRVFELERSDILKGEQKTCGHLRTKSHNMSGTKFYSIWHHVKLRCDNPNDDWYHIYGGAGITYDPRWKEFNNFYDDMYEDYLIACDEYGEEDISIDRKDSAGDYNKKNCRFVIPILQSNNQKRSKGINYNGINYNTDEFAERFGLRGLSANEYYDRIFREHWDPMIAVNTPSEKMLRDNPNMRYLEFFDPNNPPEEYLEAKKSLGL